MEAIKFIIENLWEIAFLISIIVGLVQTFRNNRKGFWIKLKEVSMELIKEAEGMDFKTGEGQLKMDFVVDKLLEEFGSKFSFINRNKLEKIVEKIVISFNSFSDLN